MVGATATGAGAEAAGAPALEQAAKPNASGTTTRRRNIEADLFIFIGNLPVCRQVFRTMTMRVCTGPPQLVKPYTFRVFCRPNAGCMFVRAKTIGAFRPAENGMSRRSATFLLAAATIHKTECFSILSVARKPKN